MNQIIVQFAYNKLKQTKTKGSKKKRFRLSFPHIISPIMECNTNCFGRTGGMQLLLFTDSVSWLKYDFFPTRCEINSFGMDLIKIFPLQTTKL